MITEDYVSFETAKLLKDKGFEGENRDWYNMEGFIEEVGVDDGIDPTAHEDIFNNIIPAPTLQMAMKWLRKWHNLHCDVGYDFRLGWHIQITSIKEVVQDHDTEMKTYLPHIAVNYPSYEDACEAAIKYCLEKLI